MAIILNPPSLEFPHAPEPEDLTRPKLDYATIEPGAHVPENWKVVGLDPDTHWLILKRKTKE